LAPHVRQKEGLAPNVEHGRRLVPNIEHGEGLASIKEQRIHSFSLMLAFFHYFARIFFRILPNNHYYNFVLGMYEYIRIFACIFASLKDYYIKKFVGIFVLNVDFQ